MRRWQWSRAVALRPNRTRNQKAQLEVPLAMSVSDLAEGLLRDYTVNGYKSLRTVKRRWEIHLAPCFGHLDATELSSEQIELYITRRRQEGAENSSINRELAALRRAYSLAIIAGKFPFF